MVKEGFGGRSMVKEGSGGKGVLVSGSVGSSEDGTKLLLLDSG